MRSICYSISLHSWISLLKQYVLQTYRQDEIRNQVWMDITLAEALMGVDEYGEATYKARGALITCHAINSVQNVATLVAIYSRLLTSSYRTSADVKESGDMLREWYEVEQEKALRVYQWKIASRLLKEHDQ